MNRACALLGSLLAVSCAHVPTDVPTRSSLVGVWYGNAHDAMSGSTGDNVSTRNADGTFVTYFRLCDDQGELSTLLESGTWEFADGIETTRTLKVDGVSVNRIFLGGKDFYLERYRVAVLANDQLSLASLRTDERYPPPEFIETRINGAEFHLPVDPCAPTSRPALD